MLLLKSNTACVSIVQLRSKKLVDAIVCWFQSEYMACWLLWKLSEFPPGTMKNSQARATDIPNTIRLYNSLQQLLSRCTKDKAHRYIYIVVHYRQSITTLTHTAEGQHSKLNTSIQATLETEANTRSIQNVLVHNIQQSRIYSNAETQSTRWYKQPVINTYIHIHTLLHRYIINTEQVTTEIYKNSVYTVQRTSYQNKGKYNMGTGMNI